MSGVGNVEMKKLKILLFSVLFIAYAVVYASTAYEFYIQDYFEAGFLVGTSVIITVLPIILFVRSFRARRKLTTVAP
jgi:hypothetical protein